MVELLRKYDTTTGRTHVADESSDIFGMSAVRLGGVLFDKDNISTKAELQVVNDSLTALQSVLNAHIYQNGIDHQYFGGEIDSLYELIGMLSNDLGRIYNDSPIEERIETTDGQTVLVASTLQWSPDHAIRDLIVYRNGVRLDQDTSGGTAHDYTKLDSTRIRLNNRTARADDRFYLRMERSNLSSAPTSYYYVSNDGYLGRGIPTPNPYTVSSERLTVFLNGVLLIASTSVGDPVDRYEESSPTFIALGESILNENSVVSFLNQTQSPNYRFVQTGVTGTTLTIPAYTIGNKQLKVWRNGILMNNQSLGSSDFQYTESSTTTIELASAALSEDIFVFENANQAPQFREDITGVTGTTITLANSYTPGDQHLLVFRNGVLMFKSPTLGNPVDRYSESSSTTIELDDSATSGEVFSIIYL